MPDKKFKVLVFNPSTENIEKAVQLVNAQNKKAGPFEFSLFLGDNFTNPKTDLASLNPDIPIYFTKGEKKILDTSNLHHNFSYLGEIGVHKLSCGLKIGYVYGNLKEHSSEDIIAKFRGQQVDILITYLWPDAIAKEEKLLLCGDTKLDSLIDAVKPQYWFACGGDKGRYFERKPYSIDGRITRFISLATMDLGRWYFAFNISLNPLIPQGIKLSDHPTTSTRGLKRNDAHFDEDKDILLKKKNALSNSNAEVTQKPCFLCLSTPNFELHMVISVGNLCFLTISRGPLTLKKELGFSGHGMIVLIEHYPTLRSYVQSGDNNEKVEDSAVVKEITKYETSLVSMFRSLGNYSVIFWEISRKRSVHGHIQFVPVDDRIILNFQKVLESQIQYDKKLYPEPLHFIKFTKDDDLTELNDVINTQNYVLFTVYERSNVIKYLIKLGTDDDKYFDSQFPRKVVAVLLNLKNRIHWLKCKETREEESVQKANFQDKYHDFDVMKKDD
jgi:hypothetical protein